MWLTYADVCHRSRLESSSFVQSPVTVPAPRLFTSTLCTILKSSPSHKSEDLSVGSPDQSLPCGSNPVLRSNSPNSATVPERRTPSKTSQNVTTAQAFGTLNPNPDLRQTCCPEPLAVPDPDLHNYTQSKTVICENTSLTQSLQGPGSGLRQDKGSIQNSKEATHERDSLTRTSVGLTTQSSPSDPHSTVQHDSNISTQESPAFLRKTKPQIDPVPEVKGFSETPNPQNTDPPKPQTSVSQTTTPPHIICLSQPPTGSRTGLDQERPPYQTSNEAASAPAARGSSSTTTTTITQQTVYRQSVTADSSQSDSSFDQEPPEDHSPPQSNSVSSISICSTNRISGKNSHEAASPLHGSPTSTLDQQSVHGSSMSPSSPAQPAVPHQPRGQTPALAEQANPHVTPPPSPPHLLTPHQDPDICLPMVIREEIRLTPQIQGPPLSLDQSLPQGKVSRHVSPCFTKPLSQATVMEGSPVTLEVEVMGHREPTLTWWVAYNQLHGNAQISWGF